MAYLMLSVSSTLVNGGVDSNKIHEGNLSGGKLKKSPLTKASRSVPSISIVKRSRFMFKKCLSIILIAKLH